VLAFLFVLMIVAALMQTGWSGYVALGAAVALYICYVLYADMVCPSCGKRLLNTDRFFPPKDMWRPMRECPHCKADLTRELTTGGNPRPEDREGSV
jgi:hypothetical protein